MVKMPRQKREQLANIKGYISNVRQEEGREPTTDEIVEWSKNNLGLSRNVALALIKSPETVYSLYSVVPGQDQDEEQELLYKIVDKESDAENETDRKMAYENIVKYIDKNLPEKQATALKIKFGIHITPDEATEGLMNETSDRQIAEIMNSMGFYVTGDEVNDLINKATITLSQSDKFKKLLLERKQMNKQSKHFIVV